MYHYIREGCEELPFFRYLHIDDFRKQLDFFRMHYDFLTKNEFITMIRKKIIPPVNRVLLTFDDAFIDHYHYVLPELRRRGLWGIFFVPTAIWEESIVLDVHKIHYLLGRFGGLEMSEALKSVVTESMLVDRHNKDFRTLTYSECDNDEATTFFQRSLNYYISYDHRQKVIDALIERYPTHDNLHSLFYMNEEQLRALHEAGMLVGSHSRNHLLMSKISEQEQRKEIIGSFNYLNELLGPLFPKTFCYPYGGLYSFSSITEKLLEKAGVSVSFNVESRDFGNKCFRNRPQALPRYDCNEFPHGQARMGIHRKTGENHG